jgi:hypothetical protein
MSFMVGSLGSLLRAWLCVRSSFGDRAGGQHDLNWPMSGGVLPPRMTLRPMTSTSKQSSQQNAAHGGQRQTPKASSSSGDLRRHPSLVGAIDLHARTPKLGRSMSDLLTTVEW